jgi:hypothetical protein
MKTRRAVRGVLKLSVAACVVALAFGVTVRLLGAVTEANCRRLQPGMHLREVEAIFGASADRRGAGREMCMRIWHGQEGDAVVIFWMDRAEKAFFVPSARTQAAPPDLFHYLRTWLGW